MEKRYKYIDTFYYQKEGNKISVDIYQDRGTGFYFGIDAKVAGAMARANNPYDANEKIDFSDDSLFED